MRALPGVLSASVDLASAADTVTKLLIASVGLIAGALVLVGLVRAWSGRRRAQVVLEDLGALEGFSTSTVAGLSPLLRQEVRRALQVQGVDAAYAHLNTLAKDVTSGLLHSARPTTITAVRTELQATTRDSLTALSAGVRALAPKEAEGLMAVLSACLPAQRGCLVRSSPTLRGTAAGSEIGLTLEFAQLGHAPDAVTTFWSGAVAVGTEQERSAIVHNALSTLLEPAAMWIAIRLVAQYLASSGHLHGRGSSLRQPPADLLGLRLQLTGQMSLYATRRNERFYRGFAEQALEDLEQAARLLPQYFRPHSTQAAVQERVGWSHRKGADTESAARAFIAAVRAYDRAEKLVEPSTESASSEAVFLTREAIRVRRTKCRLLCGDAGQAVIAGRELRALEEARPSGTIALYNAACLLAVALTVGAGDDEQRLRWRRRMWELLGRSLLVGGTEGPWNIMLADVELDHLDRSTRRRFSELLKTRHPGLEPLTDDQAGVLVDDVLTELGATLEPPV